MWVCGWLHDPTEVTGTNVTVAMTRASNERVLEQFIAGIRHTELQNELLSTAQDFSTEPALERDRTYEASNKEQTSMQHFL